MKMMFLFFLSHWSYPRHPDVRFVLVLLQVLSDPADQFERFLFCMCSCVLDCIIYYCEQIVIFSVELKKKKPKGVLFYFIFAHFCFTLTENISSVCCLSIPICCRNDCFVVLAWHCVAFVAAESQTVKVLAEDGYCLLFYMFFFLLESCFVVTERCGMCNTAYCNLCRPRIVALYFLSMGFVSVQAETTCIFQMLYL